MQLGDTYTIRTVHATWAVVRVVSTTATQTARIQAAFGADACILSIYPRMFISPPTLAKIDLSLHDYRQILAWCWNRKQKPPLIKPAHFYYRPPIPSTFQLLGTIPPLAEEARLQALSLQGWERLIADIHQYSDRLPQET
ncbi:MAG: hypothetical protein Fur005_32700 [Roseiflexaceae bacterium]